MTDREKIEFLLQVVDEGGTVSISVVAAEVERLIRDAAERAWLGGFSQSGDNCAAWRSHHYCEFPADFPLVADKERAG